MTAPRRRRNNRDQPNPGGGGQNQQSSVYQDAVRDVMLSLRPSRQAIRRSRRQGIADYRQFDAQAQNIGQQFQHQIAPLGGAYDAQIGDITGDLQGQLGSLTGLLGTSIGQVPDAERIAGANMMGTVGAGSLEGLASDRARNAGYQTSAQRQGAIETMTTRRNATTDLQNFLDDLSNQQQDLYSGSDSLIRQREDQLRQQAFDRAMALKNYNLNASSVGAANASNAAFGDYLQQLLGRLFSGGGGPRNRRNQGGGLDPTGGWGFPSPSPGAPDPATTGQTGPYTDAQGNLWINGVNYGRVGGSETGRTYIAPPGGWQ